VPCATTGRIEKSAEGAQVIDDPIRVMKHGVEIVIDRPVLEDLKYRLLFQYPDLCEDEPNRAALIRAAEKAWQVLSEAAQLMGIDDIKVPLFETLPDSE
jgi:hypothetical protein